MTDEFPGNSHSAKNGPKLDRIVTGDVRSRKQPLRKRFSETFVRGDARSVWGYVFWDVMVPKVQDTVVDMAQEGVSRLIFGDARRGGRATGGSSTNYHDRFNPDRALRGDREQSRMTRRGRATHDFREILITSRVEAEEALETLQEACRVYGSASVADFYTLVGEPKTPTDQNWGWTDLGDSIVRRDRDEYYLDMPSPRPFD